MSIQALREQYAARGKALQELVAKEDWNPEADQPIYDQGMAELDDIGAKIKRHDEVNARLAERTRELDVADAAERRGVNNKDPGLVIYAKWLRGGDKALKEEDWAHYRAAMSTTTGSEGGFTVDSEVAISVLDALKAYGGMRAPGMATVMQTDNGAQWSYPTSDGTNEEGEIVDELQ